MKKLFSTTLLGSVLLASTSAFANVGVKVECYGNCNNVYLFDVCSGIGQQYVLAVACDDTVDPAPGEYTINCGSGRCAKEGDYYGKYLGYYCKDGNGYDAVVTCAS